jgi:hypothetical protein
MVLPTKPNSVAATVNGSTHSHRALGMRRGLVSLKKFLKAGAVPSSLLIFATVPWILSFHLDTHQQLPKLLLSNDQQPSGGHSSPKNLIHASKLKKLERLKLHGRHGDDSTAEEPSTTDDEDHRIDSHFTRDEIIHTNSTNLPEWMKEYFLWHETQIQQLSVDNWDERDETQPGYVFKRRFLILRCYAQDERCGGLSDRLKPLPLMLLAAARSGRIFFISWSRPCRIEEFLRPGPALNWSLPDWLDEAIAKSKHPNLRSMSTRASTLIENAMRPEGQTIYSHLHDFQGGSTQYNEDQGPNMYETVYHDLFHALITPSPPIAKRIKELLAVKSSTSGSGRDEKPLSNSQTLLIPGQYTVAHYRAEYGNEVNRHPMLTSPEFLQRVALNALNCASSLYPGGAPIYFASDSMLALEAVRNFSATSTRPIVTFNRSEAQPLHLDKLEVPDGEVNGDYTLQTDIERKREIKRQVLLRKAQEAAAGGNGSVVPIDVNAPGLLTEDIGTNATNAPMKMRRTIPSEFYSTFVDFYIAGNARCVSYGRGGFGRFANILSYDWTCSNRHVKNFWPSECAWHD